MGYILGLFSGLLVMIMLAFGANQATSTAHTHVEFRTCDNLSWAYEELDDQVVGQGIVINAHSLAIITLFNLLPPDVLEEFMDPDYAPIPKLKHGGM